MKLLVSIFAISLFAFSSGAQSFQKLSDNSNKANAAMKSVSISSEKSMQPVHERSLEMMRVMVGGPLNTKNLGPALQAEWLARLSHRNPVYAAAGIGYLIETRPNSEGIERTFHSIPLYINLGYTAKILSNWSISLAAGPVLRQTFERGNNQEQHRNYAYGDLIGGLSLEYEWVNALTGNGQAVGLRGSRMFGLANSDNVSPIDAVLASFAFDL